MSVVRRVLDDGSVRWDVRWREGGRHRSRSFDRKRDAHAFDADVRRRQRLGDVELLDAGRERLADFAQEWWQTYAEQRLAPKTQEVYADLWDRHVLPRLGGSELRRITPEAVERFQAEMRTAGAGPPTIVKTLALLQSVLQRAVVWRRIAANPVAAIRKPRQQRSRLVVPPSLVAIETMRARLRANDALRDATLVAILAYAGLRPGEALALRWGDVRAQTLMVDEAISLGEVSDTKTRRARTVRLLEPLAEDLADYRAACDDASDGALLFPRRDGTPWVDHDYRNWRRRVFGPAAKDAGLPNARPYDLRHAFCSLLLAEGRSVVEVAAQAGHAPTMTLDTYGHILEELAGRERRAAEVVIGEAHGEVVRREYDATRERAKRAAVEKRESPAFAGLSRGALLRTRTADPLLTMQVRGGNRGLISPLVGR